MATVFVEGFDKYGPVNELNPNIHALFTQGEWTNVADPFNSMAIVAPLSATGGAIWMQAATLNPAQLRKTLAGNYSRLIAGFRFSNTLAAIGGGGIVFRDAGTAQCAVTIDWTGKIMVRTGGSSGTVIATSLASISANSVHYLEVDITFGSSAAYQVWLDGASIITGTGTTITNAHPYANELVVGDTGGANYQMTFDDLYLFDSSGTTNNAAALTSPRIETRFPTSDAQTEWSNVASLLGTAYSITNNANAPGANQLFLRKHTSAVAQTINSVSCVPEQSFGLAKFAAVIYSDNAGLPDALLSDGIEVIGTASGVTLTSNLTTPQNLSASTDYWIGFITDTSVNLQQTDTLTFGQKAANPYVSGAPGTAPSMTTTQPDWNVWGNCVGAATNWEAVDHNPSPGDLSGIASSAPGDEDLYGFPSLTTSASNIYTVAVKGNIKRSDTGARTIDLRLKSGSTDSAGSNPSITPGTSYGWIDSYHDLDPNGDVAWTASAANTATAGPKVAS